MRYYKFMENGAVCFIQASEREKTRPGYVEIVQDEFKTLGGVVPSPDTTSGVEPSPIETLTQENKILRAQLQLQEEQLTLFGDCMAELAAQVYP